MKRKIFAVLAIGAVALASCKKEEPTPPAEPGSATIEGTLWANTNADNDTDDFGFPAWNPEYAKSGVVVTAIVDGYDLDQTPDPSYDYQEMKYTTTIGSNGSYSLSVPCYNEAITVELRFNDYTDQQLMGGSNQTTTFFMGGSQYVTVWDGAVVINDYEYNY